MQGFIWEIYSGRYRPLFVRYRPLFGRCRSLFRRYKKNFGRRGAILGTCRAFPGRCRARFGRSRARSLISRTCTHTQNHIHARARIPARARALSLHLSFSLTRTHAHPRAHMYTYAGTINKDICNEHGNDITAPNVHKSPTPAFTGNQMYFHKSAFYFRTIVLLSHNDITRHPCAKYAQVFSTSSHRNTKYLCKIILRFCKRAQYEHTRALYFRKRHRIAGSVSYSYVCRHTSTEIFCCQTTPKFPPKDYVSLRNRAYCQLREKPSATAASKEPYIPAKKAPYRGNRIPHFPPC